MTTRQLAIFQSVLLIYFISTKLIGDVHFKNIKTRIVCNNPVWENIKTYILMKSFLVAVYTSQIYKKTISGGFMIVCLVTIYFGLL